MADDEELCDECGDPVEFINDPDLVINDEVLCAECIQHHEDEQL